MEMAEKKKFEPRWKAEFSMGQLDYERYDKILMAIDNYAVLASQEPVNYIKPYLSSLRQFFRQLRPILPINVKEKYDKEFNNLEDEVNNFLETRFKLTIILITKKTNLLLKKIGELNNEVLVMKQLCGLGIIVSKKETLQKRLERALGISG